LPEILPPLRGLLVFIPSNPQLKLRAIFIRRSAALRLCGFALKLLPVSSPSRDISPRRQPDDFAQRRPRFELNEASQFCFGERSRPRLRFGAPSR
jgi:hypothetical protein